MRLVFVLYAEERDLMPADALYQENYGLRGLFKKLRGDAAHHGDDLMSAPTVPGPGCWHYSV